MVHEIVFLREERKHDMLKLSQFQLEEPSAGMVESVVYTENDSRN